ncbi:hypothetical protein C1645_782637 [Glomus cerebriforme]|uniref:Uncharacterized protein n=1 Tax=Glomus cerebriforme TaxID=658196 RepID=A0A397SFV2_9GLOM|nr:hypothetical protein C1645_782637 [Glomus cerebriforme]
MAPGLFVVTGPISDDGMILVESLIKKDSLFHISLILSCIAVAVGLFSGSECQHSFIKSI